ncbi:cell division protein ZapE [uncultured Paracoccus sp.]|uniref:cell division protein ZapE n=1 Tax=uncultured Paracoccus sp. TaxID=189685 RepID=UPI002613C8F9|nr:cell division protein ZapE [uncultured Paracoccus sp.]
MTHAGPVTTLFERAVREGRIKDDPEQRDVLPILDRIVQGLAARPQPSGNGGGWLGRLFGAAAPTAAAPRGLYLWGGVGRGKSMLMDLTMQAAPIEAKRRVHFHAFMQEVQAGLTAARRTGAQDVVRPVAERIAAETRLLCFDEMQITDIADAMIVGRLFQLLFDAGVTVVTTSNRVPEDLYKHGLNRQLFLPFIALIRDRLDVVHLDSIRDHRQGRRTGDQVWFVPADAAARRELDAVWDDLTDCADPGQLRLAVNGRMVVLPGGCDRVARASFDDLCSRALGPADYLAIAQALDVLIIDDIPRLGSQNFDAARRFVTLVDTLYEARVRLIASAAADPEELYVKGTGSFEFQRTASRLHEMRDATWGRVGGMAAG